MRLHFPKVQNCRRPHLRSSAVFLCSERCEHGAVVAAVIPPPLKTAAVCVSLGRRSTLGPPQRLRPPYPPPRRGRRPKRLKPKKETAAGWSVIRRPSPNPCPRLRVYRASPPCVDLIHLLLGNVHLHRRQLKATHPRQCFNGPEVSPLGGRESPLPEVTFLERAARS